MAACVHTGGREDKSEPKTKTALIEIRRPSGPQEAPKRLQRGPQEAPKFNQSTHLGRGAWLLGRVPFLYVFLRQKQLFGQKPAFGNYHV